MNAFVSCVQNTVKAFVAETSCNQLLIDSAAYLLTVNLPTQQAHVYCNSVIWLCSIVLRFLLSLYWYSDKYFVYFVADRGAVPPPN